MLTALFHHAFLNQVEIGTSQQSSLLHNKSGSLHVNIEHAWLLQRASDTMNYELVQGFVLGEHDMRASQSEISEQLNCMLRSDVSGSQDPKPTKFIMVT